MQSPTKRLHPSQGQEAGRNQRPSLQHLIRTGAAEVCATVIALGRHLLYLLSLGNFFLKRSVTELWLKRQKGLLGQRMYANGIGDPFLLSQLAECDRQLAQARAEKLRIGELRKSRRQLLHRLVEGSAEISDRRVEPDLSRYRLLHANLDETVAAYEALRLRYSTDRKCKNRICAAYGLLLTLAVATAYVSMNHSPSASPTVLPQIDGSQDSTGDPDLLLAQVPESEETGPPGSSLEKSGAASDSPDVTGTEPSGFAEPTFDPKAAIAEYEAAVAEAEKLRGALRVAQETYQPTSSKIQEAKTQLKAAEERLARSEGPKRRADALAALEERRAALASCRVLITKIRSKKDEYKELIKEYLPRAAEPMRVWREIGDLEKVLREYPVIAQFEAQFGPMDRADASSWLAMADDFRFQVSDNYWQNVALRHVAIGNARIGNDEWIQDALAVKDRLGSTTCARIIVEWANQGKLNEAEALLDRIQVDSEKAFALAHLAVAANAGGNQPLAQQYAILAMKEAAELEYAASGEHLEVLRTAYALGSTTIKSTFRSDLSEHVERASRSDDAIVEVPQLFLQQVRFGLLDDAQMTLDDFGEAKIGEDKIKELAIAHAKVGNIQDAKELLKSQLLRTHEIDGLSRIAAIQAASGDKKGASETVERLRSVTHGYVGQLLGIQLDEDGLIRQSRYDAERHSKQSEQRLVDMAEAWKKLASAEAWAGAVDQAKATADRIGTETEKMVTIRAQALAEIADAQRERGDSDGAVETLREAGQLHFRQQVSGFERRQVRMRPPEIVAIKQAAVRDLEGALATLDNISAPRGTTVVAVVSALASEGRWDAVAELLESEPCWTSLGVADALTNTH